MNDLANLLIIDDEADILALVANILRLDHHLVDTCQHVQELSLEACQQYDLILLDVMMPDMDGYEWCSSVRPYVNCPILFLTAKSEEDDVIEGLMKGGDDYLTKPFSVRELRARVNAHLRRENREKHRSVLHVSGVTFDFEAMEVRVGEEPIHLTPNEYKLCELLVKRKDRVYSREEIYQALYGMEGDALLTSVTEFVRSIRSKFKPYGVSLISTVWGVGYKWDSD